MNFNLTAKPFHILSLSCVAVFLLPGCIRLPKQNASLTHIEQSRPLVNDFSENIDLATSSQPDFLSYPELCTIAHNPDPGGHLTEKIERFWRTPIVSNHAWNQGIIPRRPSNPHLGEFLRIGTWNVEKSLHIHDVAKVLASQDDYLELMKHRPENTAHPNEMLRQRDRLASSDILLFQEMDIGVDRSDYHDSAKLLGEKLGMNYAYAPKQIELGPVLQHMSASSHEASTLIDPSRYRGIFGLLVLSKYPIKSATSFPLVHQPYDWYEKELAEYDAIEGLRRIGANEVFKTPIEREVKIGGRVFFQVDLEVPGLPNDTLSIIHVHLEIRTQAIDRQKQMEEILSHIQNIPNPVVLAGDFNSSRYDLSPTSLSRMISRGSRNPNFWISGTIRMLVPAQSIYNTIRTTSNEIKNLYNPLAYHNQLLAPNESAAMFQMIQNFRFKDGGRFDFRGTRGRSINNSSATLANSNERALKGFRPTYAVNRPIGPFGRQRLDWIFVKSTHYSDQSESFQFAPHFGETLVAFEKPLRYRLSDHRPCVVDLPLGKTHLKPIPRKRNITTGGMRNRIAR